MRFSAILTPLLSSLLIAGGAVAFLPSCANAQGRDNVRMDEAIQDMAQAYKVRDRKRLATLLPQVRGYVLEPWAAYWDLSARLDEAGNTEIDDFMRRYAGTYQEDKLRAEWLLMLGRNRDWTAFNREYPKYRMQDDKSVRCYALLAEHLSAGTNVNTQVVDTWLPLKEADEGCAAAAEQLLRDHSMQAQPVWLRARVGL
jgi:soluble lytic murein transglycosylase